MDAAVTAEMFALESALMSGFRPINGDEQFERHVELARYALFGSHFIVPELFNMNLFGVGTLQLRTSIPIGMIGVPKPEYLRSFLKWWNTEVKAFIKKAALLETPRTRISNEDLSDRAWYFHDVLAAAHVFMRGNGRTVRLALASIRRSVNLPPVIIRYEKGDMYHRRIARFRVKKLPTILSDHGWV